MATVLTGSSEVWDALYQTVKRLGDHEARVGAFEDSGIHESSGLSFVELLAIHEYGSEAANIPGRAPIAVSLRMKRKELAVFIQAAMKRMFPRDKRGRFTSKVRDALGRFDGQRSGKLSGLTEIGKFAAKLVQDNILNGPFLTPALSPITAARKGHDRPLVDTKALANAITFKVKKR